MKNYPIIKKKNYSNLAQRKKAASSFLRLLDEKSSFLLLGHQLPDEDCIASLAALALIINKLEKDASIYLPGKFPEQISYLLEICSYNRIPIYTSEIPESFTPDVIIVLDTPKPSMIELTPRIDKLLEDNSILKAEIDHHLSADATCLNNTSAQFITSASSTCEILAYLCYKIKNNDLYKKKYDVKGLLTRNLILAILTGISGDSKNGVAFSNSRDEHFFKLFSDKLENLLRKQTHKGSENFADLGQVYQAIQSFSQEEQKLYEKLILKEEKTKEIHYVVLSQEESQKIIEEAQDYSLFVNVIKAVTDAIAEDSKKIGYTLYFDESNPEKKLYQIRIRLAKKFNSIDLREILTSLKIKDGGGHPGAIGFRLPVEQIQDIPTFCKKINEALKNLLSTLQ